LDAGLSGRETRRRLKNIDIHGEDLDAIVVSHEHGDHTRGLRILSGQLNLPVYLNYPTLSSIKGTEFNGNVREFDSGGTFSINDLYFQPFSVPHDAADPVGFIIKHKELKIGIVTDLGFATRLVMERLRNCLLLVLESNYDEEMLRSGPYPWVLKQRVKGRLGHLSNNQAGALIKDVDHEGLEHVILFHLSETNNTHEKASQVVGPFLKNHTNHPVNISLGVQDRVGHMVSIGHKDR